MSDGCGQRRHRSSKEAGGIHPSILPLGPWLGQVPVLGTCAFLMMDDERLEAISALSDSGRVPGARPSHTEVDALKIAVVTSNPKPASRIHDVALAVAGALATALPGATTCATTTASPPG
jgi:hypothetical protein